MVKGVDLGFCLMVVVKVLKVLLVGGEGSS